MLRDQFGEVGIELQLKLMERNAWIDTVNKRWEFDLAFTHFENGPDPDIGVKWVYVPSNIVPTPFSNAAGYQNPGVDELFELAAKELDRATRARAYFELQDILLMSILPQNICKEEGPRTNNYCKRAPIVALVGLR